jgi:hypothetical protein
VINIGKSVASNRAERTCNGPDQPVPVYWNNRYHCRNRWLKYRYKTKFKRIARRAVSIETEKWSRHPQVGESKAQGTPVRLGSCMFRSKSLRSLRLEKIGYGRFCKPFKMQKAGNTILLRSSVPMRGGRRPGRRVGRTLTEAQIAGLLIYLSRSSFTEAGDIQSHEMNPRLTSREWWTRETSASIEAK